MLPEKIIITDPEVIKNFKDAQTIIVKFGGGKIGLDALIASAAKKYFNEKRFEYDKSDQAMRQKLYNRQRGVCHYCRRYCPRKLSTIDHKTPLFRGGANAEPNLVMACRPCNQQKAELTEAEFFGLVPICVPTQGAIQTNVPLLPERASSPRTQPEQTGHPSLPSSWRKRILLYSNGERFHL